MRRLFLFLVTGASLALLLACTVQSGVAQSFFRAEVYWPDREIVFLADAEKGVVRSLSIRSGIVPLGKIRIPGHPDIASLLVDESSGSLWVLDQNVLHVYNATSLQALHHWVAPKGVTLTKLERNKESTIMVVAKDGHRYLAYPNRAILIASAL